MKISHLLGYGYESNVYLLHAKKTALIDTGTGRYTPSLLDELKKIIFLTDIGYIILTHEHFDHVGGTADLKQVTGASVIMQTLGATELEHSLSCSASFFNAHPKPLHVEQTVEDGDHIDLGDTILQVLHTPGHSQGSMCLYEPVTASLFSGDTVFACGDFGRTDLYGGNSKELKKSIARLHEMNVINLYPGHGEYILRDGTQHIELALHNTDFL